MTITNEEIKEFFKDEKNPLFRIAEYLSNEFGELLAKEYRQFFQCNELDILKILDQLCVGKIVASEKLQDIAKVRLETALLESKVSKLVYDYPELQNDVIEFDHFDPLAFSNEVGSVTVIPEKGEEP